MNCKSCGSALNDKKPTCSYCGAENPLYKKEEKEGNVVVNNTINNNVPIDNKRTNSIISVIVGIISFIVTYLIVTKLLK